MRDSVFILSRIQYCSYIKLMTPLSYDYIMENMTKYEHCLAWYDVATIVIII